MAKIAHEREYDLHPLADTALQLKYDFLIAEKSYDHGLCHEVSSTTR